MGYPTIYRLSSERAEDQPLLSRTLSAASHEKTICFQTDKPSRFSFGTLFRVGLAMLLASVGVWRFSFSYFPLDSRVQSVNVTDDNALNKKCDGRPCFTPARIRVRTDQDGFPSFWNYAHKGAMKVTYDRRSFFINGERALFLGGSMHPVRATPLTWNYALDEAVRNGLNMITIYVFWAAHQPFPDKDIDWSLPGGISCDLLSYKTPTCSWDLADAIRSVANRGMFVHLRIGPYDCAEYNYGGIPEWVALNNPNIAFRRPNREWMDAMEKFVTEAIAYVTKNELWSYQGGPIVMAQIENELGGDVELSADNILAVTSSGSLVDPTRKDVLGKLGQIARKATLQDYADWCGSLVERLAPNVVWTMCNGLSANNTIPTCNGNAGCSSWLENHGENGRIQIDQPGMLTEFEGGFQTWGESPHKPNTYFWGVTARSMARDALKWFARGGSHLNYYMWFGGYNRGRSAAAGIANWYASDVCLCPSGQRRQPKFGHFEALHTALSDVARTLLYARSALDEPQMLEILDEQGGWKNGTEQRMYEYKVDDEKFKHVIFVENDANCEVVVRLPFEEDGEPKILEMAENSAMLLVDGLIRFDSASIDPQAMSFERRIAEEPTIPSLLDWSAWQEPIGSSPNSY